MASGEDLLPGDLKGSLLAQATSVVLVRPEDARNIGAVARAMSNLGFSKLRLVDPAPYPEDLARSVACWGKEVVDAASLHPDIPSAIADCGEVVGFSSEKVGKTTRMLGLERWLEEVLEAGAVERALVFGPEANGLTREDVARCQVVVRIPSKGENRSFNLAQSVLLVLFSLVGIERRADKRPEAPPAPVRDVEPLVQLVVRSAEAAGFLNVHSPGHMQDVIGALIRRARPTAWELGILVGIFAKIDRKLREGPSPKSSDD